MIQQTSYQTKVLTPGQEVDVDCDGQFFYVDQCDGDCVASFDDGPKFRIRSGTEINNAPFKKFRLISPIGAGGANVTVRFYAGTLYVSNRNPLVFTRPAPTYVVPLALAIGATGTEDIPNTNLRTGQTTADRQVRVRIENVGGSANCEVRVGGVTVSTLGATASSATNKVFDFETTDQISVYSLAGTTVGVLVSYELPT